MPETNPAVTPRCAACGSDAVIPDMAPSLGGTYAVRVTLYTQPESRFKPKPVTSPGSVRVCGDCGFIMAFADDPRALWDGYIDRLSRTLSDDA